jgi:hypothetical protein
MKEGCDDDDDTNISDYAIKALMTMTIVNIDPKIQILLLIIFISHESQGRHNLQLFKGTKNLGI